MFNRFTMIGNDVNLPVFVKDLSVSKEHACIEVYDGRAYLIDKGAINGSYVNDKRVEINGKKKIVNGDILRFGTTDESFKFISSS